MQRRGVVMEFVEQARALLLPLIMQVLELSGGPAPALDDSAPPLSGFGAMDGTDLALRGFFTNILAQTLAMKAEEDVLALFFELSTTAFLGFEYPHTTAAAIDELLAAAEQIAFTMTAPSDQAH